MTQVGWMPTYDEVRNWFGKGPTKGQGKMMIAIEAQTKLLEYLIEHINHRDAAKDWQSGKGGIESLIPKLESMLKQLEGQK